MYAELLSEIVIQDYRAAVKSPETPPQIGEIGGQIYTWHPSSFLTVIRKTGVAERIDTTEPPSAYSVLPGQPLLRMGGEVLTARTSSGKSMATCIQLPGGASPVMVGERIQIKAGSPTASQYHLLVHSPDSGKRARSSRMSPYVAAVRSERCGCVSVGAAIPTIGYPRLHLYSIFNVTASGRIRKKVKASTKGLASEMRIEGRTGDAFDATSLGLFNHPRYDKTVSRLIFYEDSMMLDCGVPLLEHVHSPTFPTRLCGVARMTSAREVFAKNFDCFWLVGRRQEHIFCDAATAVPTCQSRTGDGAEQPDMSIMLFLARAGAEPSYLRAYAIAPTGEHIVVSTASSTFLFSVREEQLLRNDGLSLYTVHPSEYCDGFDSMPEAGLLGHCPRVFCRHVFPFSASRLAFSADSSCVLAWGTTRVYGALDNEELFTTMPVVRVIGLFPDEAA